MKFFNKIVEFFSKFEKTPQFAILNPKTKHIFNKIIKINAGFLY